MNQNVDNQIGGYVVETLKPCPFCGSNDIDPEGVSSFKGEYRTEENTWHNFEPHMIEHRPACNKCSATTDNEWNTRATDIRIQQLRDALQEASCRLLLAAEKHDCEHCGHAGGEAIKAVLKAGA